MLPSHACPWTLCVGTPDRDRNPGGPRRSSALGGRDRRGGSARHRAVSGHRPGSGGRIRAGKRHGSSPRLSLHEHQWTYAHRRGHRRQHARSRAAADAALRRARRRRAAGRRGVRAGGAATAESAARRRVASPRSLLSLPRLQGSAGTAGRRLPAEAPGERRALRAVAPGLRRRSRLGVDPEPGWPVLRGESRAGALRRHGAAARPPAPAERDRAGVLAGHAPCGRRGAHLGIGAHRVGSVASAALPLVGALLDRLHPLRALPDPHVRSGVVAVGAGHLHGDLHRPARPAAQAPGAGPADLRRHRRLAQRRGPGALVLVRGGPDPRDPGGRLAVRALPRRPFSRRCDLPAARGDGADVDRGRRLDLHGPAHGRRRAVDPLGLARAHRRDGTDPALLRGALMEHLSRREAAKRIARLGAILAAGGLAAPRRVALAQDDPVLAGRPLVRYPEKTDLILLTSRPPQLEPPMKYFDRAITPNEAFFVRYHVFPIPLEVDLATWRLRITGRVDRPLELSLDDLKTRFPRAAVTAVNQCSGNSRGRFSPRVLGGQWGDGAMGNAEWVGARLKDILTAAGVRQGAVQATFDGLDKPAFPSVPDFVKSLDITRIMDDPDILVAYQMNGAPLPMLNGYPARLVVPGWYATYWVKNLSEIEVVDQMFEKFWMKPAYRIPDNACGCAQPGSAVARTVPITRMTVRSFIASPTPGTRVPRGRPVTLKGIAFDGGYGIQEVQVSADRGTSWRRADLGGDLGRYSFREWSAAWTPSQAGPARVMVRAFNRIGESQGREPLWNPAGYLRNVIEHIDLQVG